MELEIGGPEIVATPVETLRRNFELRASPLAEARG